MSNLTVAETLSRGWADHEKNAPSSTNISAVLTGAADEETPWFVRALSAIGAWLAMIPIIAFLVATEMVNDDTTALAFGLAIVFVAVAARRTIAGEGFGAHLTLALSLTGQSLAVVGAAAFASDATAAGVMLMLLGGVLFFVYPDSLHRFLCVCFLVIGLAVALIGAKIPGGIQIAATITALGAALTWTQLRTLLVSRDWSAYALPLAYGLLVALLLVQSPNILYSAFNWRSLPWLATVGIGSVWLISVLFEGLRLSRSQPDADGRKLAIVALVVTALVGSCWFAPGVIASLLALTLAKRQSEKIALNISYCGFAFYLSAFYYQLDTSLLFKSASLVSAGALMLALSWWLRRSQSAATQVAK